MQDRIHYVRHAGDSRAYGNRQGSSDRWQYSPYCAWRRQDTKARGCLTHAKSMLTPTSVDCWFRAVCPEGMTGQTAWTQDCASCKWSLPNGLSCKMHLTNYHLLLLVVRLFLGVFLAFFGAAIGYMIAWMIVMSVWVPTPATTLARTAFKDQEIDNHPQTHRGRPTILRRRHSADRPRGAS